MAGYGNRTKPMEGVRQKIWAKALALRDGAGTMAVLVTLDLCDIDGKLAGEIARMAGQRTGVKREAILFNTSHTHSSPIIGDTVENYVHLMGADPAPHVAAVKRYTEFAKARIAQAIVDAVAALEPATLQFGQGMAGIAVNRRRVWKRQLPGPVDPDVPVLVVRSPQGTVKAIAAGYACHNTVMGDYFIHGDYAGYLQEALERANSGTVALFVQGAGADSNPLPRRTVELARRHGQTLADAVAEVMTGKMEAVTEPLAVAFENAPLRFQVPSRAELEARSKTGDESPKRHASRLLERLKRDSGLAATHDYPVQAFRFGSTFTLLALGGELVADYALKFKARYGWNRTWVAGYSNDVFAYIPSLRVLREGGYEGATAMEWDGHAGPFTEDVEDRVTAAVEAAMKRSGVQ